MNKQHLTWTQIEDLAIRLADRLPTDYDVMLVITRGGMVPACIISERLNLRNILVAAVMFYNGQARTLDKPIFLQFPADPLLNGRRVLIVDDVSADITAKPLSAAARLHSDCRTNRKKSLRFQRSVLRRALQALEHGSRLEEERLERFGWDRLGAVVGLDAVGAQLAQADQLVRVFDAFGGRAQTYRTRKCNFAGATGPLGG